MRSVLAASPRHMAPTWSFGPEVNNQDTRLHGFICSRKKYMKNELRSFYKKQRSLETGTEWLESSVQSFQAQCNGIIGLYYPLGSEIDPRPCVRGAGQTLALPVTTGEGQMSFYKWLPGRTPMAMSVYGIQEPQDTQKIVPNILLIPLLACDKRGVRLGYGGGYYDRYLADNPDCKRVGIGYDCQLQDEDLPAEEHDQRMHAFLSPSGLLEFSS